MFGLFKCKYLNIAISLLKDNKKLGVRSSEKALIEGVSR